MAQGARQSSLFAPEDFIIHESFSEATKRMTLKQYVTLWLNT